MPVAVITGGASGLGKAIAAKAVGRGWDVALIDRDADRLAEAAKELGAYGHPADVRDRAQLDEAFAAVAERLGGVDGLVNSAGLTRPGPSERLLVEDWRLVVDVDLSGTFYACQAAFPHLVSPGGAIVNIASIASDRGLPERVAYNAAKAGVVGLTRGLAAEWANRGIRVNALGPAWVDTPLVRQLIATGVIDEEEMLRKVPLGRLCTPDDVAEAAFFLLSGESSPFITGQTLYVDGGFTTAG